MARTKTLREKRDEHIKMRYRHHKKKNPKWQVEFVIAAVAEEMFLAPTTVGKILKGRNEQVPSHPTIQKRQALQQTAQYIPV